MIRSQDDLVRSIKRIDRKSYPAYREIKGAFDFGRKVLSIDHVQGDPYAAPSRIHLDVPFAECGIEEGLRRSRVRRIALADFLTRRIAEQIPPGTRGSAGSGRSGEVWIDSPGQEIVERTSVLVRESGLEVRMSVGLPASGRRVLADAAIRILTEQVTEIIRLALFSEHIDQNAMRRHVLAVEDQESLRAQLAARELVAFVANGSHLPRRSGIDDRPLASDRAVPFRSPPSLEVTLERPNGGPIGGMGVPRGITLIVGGGFHGKSTLLEAIQRGIYNHVPGDGREWTVTLPSAVKIRAEDGRSVSGVDISSFIERLPYGKRTDEFSTGNASGSTSQAANIVEALELGSVLLLLDEDTSATNFMIRDARMQRLVSGEGEPITPYVDRVEELYRDHGVSTVLVMGGSGDYFDRATTVVRMADYEAYQVTDQARRIVKALPGSRKNEVRSPFLQAAPRVAIPKDVGPSDGRSPKIRTPSRAQIRFGETTIDLSGVEQLVSRSQTRSIGLAIRLFGLRFTSGGSLRESLEALDRELDEKGLDLLSPFPVGDLARPRILEIAAAINRMRTLKIEHRRGR